MGDVNGGRYLARCRRTAGPATAAGGGPAGLPLRSVGDGDDPGRPKRTSTSTVYGDSSAADPLQRPHLVALWQGGSETAIPLPGSPATGPDAPGFRQVEVQGSPDAVGRVGDDI
jgi:hypothetical protein